MYEGSPMIHLLVQNYYECRKWSFAWCNPIKLFILSVIEINDKYFGWTRIKWMYLYVYAWCMHAMNVYRSKKRERERESWWCCCMKKRRIKQMECFVGARLAKEDLNFWFFKANLRRQESYACMVDAFDACIVQKI